MTGNGLRGDDLTALVHNDLHVVKCSDAAAGDWAGALAGDCVFALAYTARARMIMRDVVFMLIVVAS